MVKNRFECKDLRNRKWHNVFRYRYCWRFKNVLTNKFEIHIDNKDNPPLNLKSIKIAGPLYQLIARFPEKADFYLIYGNKIARPPDFDLKYFQEKIPKNLSNFSLGKEMRIAGAKVSDRAEGKLEIIWLWIILIFTSSLLSFLTFKMIKKKSKEA